MLFSAQETLDKIYTIVLIIFLLFQLITVNLP